jgi:hypothetical protein
LYENAVGSGKSLGLHSEINVLLLRLRSKNRFKFTTMPRLNILACYSYVGLIQRIKITQTLRDALKDRQKQEYFLQLPVESLESIPQSQSSFEDSSSAVAFNESLTYLGCTAKAETVSRTSSFALTRSAVKRTQSSKTIPIDHSRQKTLQRSKTRLQKLEHVDHGEYVRQGTLGRSNNVKHLTRSNEKNFQVAGGIPQQTFTQNNQIRDGSTQLFEEPSDSHATLKSWRTSEDYSGEQHNTDDQMVLFDKLEKIANNIGRRKGCTRNDGDDAIKSLEPHPL